MTQQKLQKLMVSTITLIGGAIGLFAPVGVVKWVMRTDPEDAGEDTQAPSASAGTQAPSASAATLVPALALGACMNERYYQLTHDYLVPSLRDWLTRKQKETRRGRAELCLSERAALWNAKPENRRLPSTLEWANIRLFTRRRNRTPPQQKMMHKAGGYYFVRGFAALWCVALLSWGVWEYSAWMDLSACAVAFSTSPSNTHAALFSGLSSCPENSSKTSLRLNLP